MQHEGFFNYEIEYTWNEFGLLLQREVHYLCQRKQKQLHVKTIEPSV